MSWNKTIKKIRKTDKIKMKAVIQRVLKASVTVNNEVISEIQRGLCVLIGIHRDDTEKDIEFIVRKLCNLRLFDGEDDKRWDKSVTQMNYEILCVSQFTLYSVMKGNKPDFHLAMPPTKAPQFYELFMEKLKKTYTSDKVKDGEFGAMMTVDISNDGPVTLIVDSRNPKGGDEVS